MSLDSIVVVGGGAAGLAAVEELRASGLGGSLTLVCGEPDLPYDRPPLSKQVLMGAWEPGRTRFREAAHYAGLDVRLVHATARSLDTDGRVVSLSDGSSLGYDGLVIATGVRPRKLPSGHDLAGVFVLRGLADVAALRSAFAACSRVVIVGAGFLGMEVAAAARSLGLDVTVVDPLPEPMIRQVGPAVGAAVAGLHRVQGVDVRTGVGVAGLAGDGGAVTGVALDDGSVLPAGCVLVAIGAVPETEWLAGCGLPVGNGVECDSYLRAAPGVYAAGDVASWDSPRYQRRMRIEHRMNATEMGMCAARNLLAEAGGGDGEAFDPLPYFWSDQYKTKIQVHGHLTPDATMSVEEGSVEAGKFVAVFRHDGEPAAVLGWSSASKMPGYRKLLLG